ncbi:hypothetical protein D6827_03175 [Candidatus Parcubacteria bacterium]|nr:MAG: hypothetical protein D6827_03175 [Candidatus Parcubacteria bacterium]
MAFLNDAALDAALNWVISNGTRIDFCSAEPTTYTQATSTLTLANQTGITLTAIANASPDGRETTIPSTVSATVTADGTVTHWALTDGIGTLVATGAMSSSVSVLVGGGSNTLDLTAAIPIRVRDAISL